jgi:macrolide transport system ATP-binding/permease protein
VRAASPRAIPSAIRAITALLRERHHIRPGQPDDFNVRDMAEMSQALSSAGVGIMNIMLVSVTERTREIGLRMAVGARASDILRQFLVEAVALCLLGGAIGILLGRGASFLVRVLLRWPTEPSLPAVVAAVVVSVTVGVVFGYYPAWKASRLDPIEALRYE